MSAENHQSNENPASLGGTTPSRSATLHLSTRLIHAGTTTDPAAFSQVKVDSSLCRFPTLRSGHARAPSFRYQRA